ncbi:unnamed protein product [Gongylonema pulchrum]|uniref:DUF2958 domain-containing protein n=1 Tax=Gongylonema pulchrum TaxID=637853 RepID=A0A183E8D5_9BILA|nr:unnamed protein product [Gongylonema pulchrum]
MAPLQEGIYARARVIKINQVRPRPMHTCENGSLKWAEEDLVALRDVLKDFEFVNMYGLKSEEEDLGVPIDQAFVFNRFGTVHYDRELFDGGQQKIYDIVERREAVMAQNNLERWQMTFPGNDEMKYHLVDREIWWETEPRQIPVVDFEWLKEHQFCQDGKLLVDVEGRIAALEKGERVYCIVDVEFELATILGRWHRAEILGLKVW